MYIRLYRPIIFNLAECSVSVLGFGQCLLQFDVSGMPNISLFTNTGVGVVKQCPNNDR